MENSGKIDVKFWLYGVLNSYSQIFFSLNKVLAVTILLVTFFNPLLGIMGLAAVFISNVMAYTLGFNRNSVQEGLFGFGALLLGLALGYEYEVNPVFCVLFFIALVLLLITTALLTGFFGKHSLPVLSFPFLFTYWIVFLASTSLHNIHVNEMHAYSFNEIKLYESSTWYTFIHSLDQLNLPVIVSSYFKTLSGTFFIDSILGGILIAAGLFYFSRIAFSLSILGFGAAFFFYKLFGANTNDLTYHLMGSNFVFMAIGIGCFYIIPSIYSYITVIILTPVLLLLMLFLTKTLGVFELKALTLPFSILTAVFLYAMHQRWLHKFLHLVTIQYYSAEKTIYKYRSSLQRFKHAHLAKLALPFWGQWKVSQGYNGKITHLGDWNKALDFVITDTHNKTYKEPGISKEDFYCYDKPVLAPADGYIYNIINHVEDNDITDVNTEYNWGNTIIMNHLNGLFSQISHIKKDSFKVAIGEFVTKGALLASCGNSGRSPEPHIHFQLQALPEVGAKTLAYPIAYFIDNKNDKVELKIFEVPAEESIISNVNTTGLVKAAFNFIPGKKIKFQDENGSVVVWEVFTDAYNRTYLYCHNTKSVAYFVQDGTMIYFTDFEGSKKSLLFSFYLAAYRILLGAYDQITVHDKVPVMHFNTIATSWIQDLIAPFYIFTKVEYNSAYTFIDNDHEPENVKIGSSVITRVGKLFSKQISFELSISNNCIELFTIVAKGNTHIYKCV